MGEVRARTLFNPVFSPFSGFQQTHQQFPPEPAPGADDDSLGSAGSIASLGSAGSIFSIGSAGSILSIGSAGSILSIGSAGSVLSIFSIGSVGSIGSAFSVGAVGGFAQSRPQVVQAAGTMLGVAALLAAVRG